MAEAAKNGKSIFEHDRWGKRAEGYTTQSKEKTKLNAMKKVVALYESDEWEKSVGTGGLLCNGVS